MFLIVNHVMPSESWKEEKVPTHIARMHASITRPNVHQRNAVATSGRRIFPEKAVFPKYLPRQNVKKEMKPVKIYVKIIINFFVSQM